MVISVIYYCKLNIFGVSDRWLDKSSKVKMSLGSGNLLWAIAAIEDTLMSFSIVSGYFWVLLT